MGSSPENSLLQKCRERPYASPENIRLKVVGLFSGPCASESYVHQAALYSITRIDEGFLGGARSFPLLQEFELRFLESLEEWITMYSDEENGVKELIMC
jgi:hypothetical protein